MKIIVIYEVDLKDKELCLGCPYSKIKEEGLDYGGGCDCSSEDRCNCTRRYSYRNKDKDLWECAAYRETLNIGQIPRRGEKCKGRGQMKDTVPELLELDKAKTKAEKEFARILKKYNKATKLNKRFDKLMTNLPDKYAWQKLMSDTMGRIWE